MSLVLRKGTQEDGQAFVELLALVKAGMAHKEWFHLEPPEVVLQRIAAGEMELWVAMDANVMAAGLSVLYPGLGEENYGYDLGLPKEQLARVVNMDTAAVHPDYRGMGLQKQLMRMAQDALMAGGRRILLCTIHPDNLYSLDNALEEGYTIQAKRRKYDSVRYLLRKDIP